LTKPSSPSTIAPYGKPPTKDRKWVENTNKNIGQDGRGKEDEKTEKEWTTLEKAIYTIKVNNNHIDYYGLYK